MLALMPRDDTTTARTPRERAYIVEERLAGTAEYLVWARNKREALAKVRSGEAPEMLDSRVEHLGTGHVRRATEAEAS